MNLFKHLETSGKFLPRRILLYGMPGIGTSTFAAGLAAPVLIPADDSTSHIAFPPCPRFPIAKRFADLMQAMEELYVEPHDYSTLILDPLDAVDLLIREQVCCEAGVKDLHEVPRRADRVLTYWRRLLRRLDLLRSDIDLHVVLVARAQTERATSGADADYAKAKLRHVPALSRHPAALLERWCDEVLFATHSDQSRPACASAPPGDAVNIPDGPHDDLRLIYTTSSPAHMAKNRLNLPPRLAFKPAALLPYLQPPLSSHSNSH